MNRIRKSMLILMAISAIVLAYGCSGDRTTGPDTATRFYENGISYSVMASEGDPVQFAARVATTNESQRMLTFYGVPDTVIAALECEIVRLNNGNETPIPFVDIVPGDSMQVCGIMQQNGYILAHRLRIFGGECPQYDVAFRDTIVSIDYEAGTFTVIGRTETITTDENTIIWGTLITRHPGGDGQQEPPDDSYQGFLKANPDPDCHYHYQDTLLALTDLQAGDVVEVRGYVVNETTLLAAMIKLANCNDKVCEEFSAYIETLDCTERSVTFVGYSWAGYVCPGAELLALDGTVLELCDFSAGDYVSVKGFPLEDDGLRISRMAMDTPD